MGVIGFQFCPGLWRSVAWSRGTRLRACIQKARDYRKDSQHHHLAAMEPRTDPCVAILPVVHAFAVRDTALVVSNVFVAIGSDENALPVLGTFLEVARIYLFSLPLYFDPKLTNGLDREIAMLV